MDYQTQDRLFALCEAAVEALENIANSLHEIDKRQQASDDTIHQVTIVSNQ